MSAWTEHDIALANGAIAHYVEAGPPDGSPVMLLHGGLPGSSGTAGWRFMLPYLAELGLRVIAPDRPGFGQADTRPEHWPRRGFLSWMQYVVDLLDALGIDRVRLGGNSQGTQTAAYVATRFPERVECLALIACGGFNPTLEIPTSALTPGVPFPTWEGTEESMRTMLTTIVHRKESIDDALVAQRTRDALVQRDSLAAADAWNRRAIAEPTYGQSHRLLGHLDRLAIPIVYLYGRQDVLSPVENAYLQEDLLPNVQFFYPDDCGHQAQTDRPEIVNRLFGEFLTTGRVTRATAEAAGVSTRRPELPGIVS